MTICYHVFLTDIAEILKFCMKIKVGKYACYMEVVPEIRRISVREVLTDANFSIGCRNMTGILNFGIRIGVDMEIGTIYLTKNSVINCTKFGIEHSKRDGIVNIGIEITVTHLSTTYIR